MLKDKVRSMGFQYDFPARRACSLPAMKRDKAPVYQYQ